MSFSGSYAPEDVTLLLRVIDPPTTPPAEKEQLIQSGALHYSELLAREAPPTDQYMAFYHAALAENGALMAKSVVSLAKGIAQQVDGEIALVSLARAGLPVGVLLKRALGHLGRSCQHYGISIICDRGLDHVAMAHILANHAPETVVFVDGWTGKGAIAAELSMAAPDYGVAHPRLTTLGDIGGFAWMAPTKTDWLIPSGILGGVVSGLISRTVLNDDIRRSGGYHGCTTLPHLAAHDISRDFIHAIATQFDWASPASAPLGKAERIKRRNRVRHTIDTLCKWHNITNLNRIRPSLAEATRAVLCRRPHMVYVASDTDNDTAPLMHLIHQNDIPYEVAPDLIAGYRAITITEKTS